MGLNMKRARFAFITSMLIFGSIGLFVRNINLSSGKIALIRGIIGSLFLLISSLILKQKITWKAVRPNLILLILSGTSIGFNWILLFEAYQYTSISNATLSYYFAPVFVILLSPILLKERLTARKLFCVLCAITGMFLVMGIGKETGKNNLLGVGYGLMAAMLYAIAILLNKFMRNISGMETTLIQLSSASLVLLPYILLTEPMRNTELDTKSVLLLLIVGIIHTGAGYLLYFTGIKKLNGQVIALYSYIDPISAIMMSAVFIGEKMTVFQLLGGVLILGAALYSDLADRSLRKKEI